jgi:hypothetical protein
MWKLKEKSAARHDEEKEQKVRMIADDLGVYAGLIKGSYKKIWGFYTKFPRTYATIRWQILKSNAYL